MEPDATEADKLHLIMVCADELAPRYGLEPEELWGAGWLGVRVAEATWVQGRPFLPLARECIKVFMRKEVDYLYGRRRRFLTGGTEKNP